MAKRRRRVVGGRRRQGSGCGPNPLGNSVAGDIAAQRCFSKYGACSSEIVAPPPSPSPFMDFAHESVRPVAPNLDPVFFVSRDTDHAEAMKCLSPSRSAQRCLSDCHIAYEAYVQATTPHDYCIPGSSGSGQITDVHDSVNSDSMSVAQSSKLPKTVQVFVKVLDCPTVSIQMKCKSSVRQMVKDALRKSRIYLCDPYIEVNGKILDLDKLIGIGMRDATFIISPRIRGGFPDIPKTISLTLEYEELYHYILRQGDLLFDVVRFTDPPCRSLSARYFVSLGKAGRKVYKWLFTMIELIHANKRCLKRFTIWDIVYVKQFDCLMFRAPHFENWSTAAYRQNILDGGSILESYLRYSPDRVAANRQGIHEMDKSSSMLPNHLHHLVDYIKGMTKRNEVEDGWTPQWRSVFLLDPSGMSSAEKIALILSLDLKVKYLSSSERNALFSLLGGSPIPWFDKADAVPILKAVRLFKVYDHNTGQYRTGNYKDGSLYSLWLLGRNYLSHSERKQMDLKAAEAMFCFLFIYLLPLVIRLLIRRYRSPAVASARQNSLTFSELLDKA